MTRQQALVKHLLNELGSKSNVKEFSDSLRYLDICDLQSEEELDRVTGNGYIDTLVVLYQFGTLTKLVQVKKSIKEK